MNKTIITDCPECGAGLSFSEVAIIGENMLVNGYESIAECPHCHVKWEWAKSGELRKSDSDDEYITLGKRRPTLLKVCECDCGEGFQTTHPDRHYLNSTHRMRGRRKGIVVDEKKRNVRTRERTN